MIEIVLLTAMNRLMRLGLAPIIATRTVAADAPMLQRLLSDPVNQLRLASALCALPRGAAAIRARRDWTWARSPASRSAWSCGPARRDAC